MLTKSREPFQETLSNSQRENWLRENIVTHMRLGIQKMSLKSIKKLMTAHDDKDQSTMTENEKFLRERQRLKGFYSYDMLLLNKMSRQLEYLPCHYPDRSKYVISEETDQVKRLRSYDVVRLAVDLAYIEEGRARGLDFANYESHSVIKDGKLTQKSKTMVVKSFQEY